MRDALAAEWVALSTRCPLSKKADGQGCGHGSRIRPFRHSGIVPVGPLPENPGKGEPKHLSLCSDPLTLDIRPLSPNHNKLFHSVQSLKNLAWSDLQIADHFNQAGRLVSQPRLLAGLSIHVDR